jgi:hypothetical protein
MITSGGKGSSRHPHNVGIVALFINAYSISWSLLLFVVACQVLSKVVGPGKKVLT